MTWIKCSEQMPPPNKKILTCLKVIHFGGRYEEMRIITIAWTNDDGVFINAAPFIVTHWQNLPELPEEEE